MSGGPPTAPGTALPEPPGYPAQIPRPAALQQLHEVMVRCTRCDLFISRTQVVPGAGDERARLLLVGEAPGRTEDIQGRPFVGRSGELLQSMFAEAGLERKDVFIANVVRCRPPDNRNPRAAELKACSGWLREQIRLISPLVVVTLGRFALQHFLPKARITAVQGQPLALQYDTSPLMLYPLLHPSAILRNLASRGMYADQFRRLARLLEGSRDHHGPHEE